MILDTSGVGSRDTWGRPWAKVGQVGLGKVGTVGPQGVKAWASAEAKLVIVVRDVLLALAVDMRR